LNKQHTAIQYFTASREAHSVPAIVFSIETRNQTAKSNKYIKGISQQFPAKIVFSQLPGDACPLLSA
jgi:hypothetical protein